VKIEKISFLEKVTEDLIMALRTILVIILISMWVNSQAEIEFEFEYSIEILDTDYWLVNVWLADYHEVGDDHIYVVDYDYNTWRLIEYDLAGDTLAFFSETLAEYEQMLGCKIFMADSTLYKAVLYCEDCETGILEISEYVTGELVTSVNVFENWNCWDCLKSFCIYNQEGTEYIYLGIEDYDEHRYANWGHRLFKYSFEQGSLEFIEEIWGCGSQVISYNDYENLVTFEDHGWVDWTERHYNKELKLVSQNYPAEVVEITSDYHGYSFAFTDLNKNDTNYNEYGLILWNSSNDSFRCYSPDFSEILWETCNSGITNMWIRSSSCISTNLGDNFIIYFYMDYYDNEYVEVRNRENGWLALSEAPVIMANTILRKSNGELLFFCYSEENSIDIYSLGEEIQLHNDDNEIMNNENLLTNYPNPFNPETVFSFTLNEPGQVKLEIYNLKGQKVKTLCDEWKTELELNILWQGDDENGQAVSTGIYFARLEYDGVSYCRKCILLK
jgi:hypothetical protein